MFVIKRVVLKPEHVCGAKQTVYSHSCLSTLWNTHQAKTFREMSHLFVNSKLIEDTVLKALGSQMLHERKISLMPLQRHSDQQARVQFPGLAVSQVISLIFVCLCSIS